MSELRSGPHKRAASSHSTLTAVPAPHPWQGRASGPLCQAKLLGDHGGHKTYYEVLQPGSGQTVPFPADASVTPSPSYLPILVALGGADLNDTGESS